VFRRNPSGRSMITPRLMTQVLVGTSGYSFKTWKGHFYPAKLPERQFLPFYAERLETVELNNTFYRTPSPEAIAGWRSAVPPTFRFSVKAPQRITHLSRLKDVSLLGPFAELMLGFGEQLGVVLFQFPPQFGLNLERVYALRDAWPKEIPTALEFRHPAWDIPEVRDWMRAEGFAWVVNDAADDAGDGTAVDTNVGAEATHVPHLDAEVVRAAAGGGAGYVRLRRPTYTEAELKTWAERLKNGGAERCFVFFKHEVSGPQYAATLRRLVEAKSE
jgi:uncharacterized protein YecE (DUF72 family)